MREKTSEAGRSRSEEHFIFFGLPKPYTIAAIAKTSHTHIKCIHVVWNMHQGRGDVTGPKGSNKFHEAKRVENK